MNESQQPGHKCSLYKWLLLFRCVAALILITFLGFTLFYVGGKLLPNETIHNHSAKSDAERKESSDPAPKEENSDLDGGAEQLKRAVTKLVMRPASTQEVWVYGLQLAAWLGIMGVLLWAIVVLIRDE